eukprot:scaffold14589_cov106-Cylindrotheca_fusiformis.AAC.4
MEEATRTVATGLDDLIGIKNKNATSTTTTMTVEDTTAYATSPTSVTLVPAPNTTTTLDSMVLTPTSSTWKKLPASQKSIRTVNPIRAIVDPIARNIKTGEQRGDGKDHISLALGDPTVGGNLKVCPEAITALVEAAETNPHCAGYINACGTLQARNAIAKHHSYQAHDAVIGPDNVIVANGCSGALELALTALLDTHSTLLVPQPGFPLYQVIAESHGANVAHYRLDPEDDWKIDMDHLEEQFQNHSDVRAIVVNNPSNPTGCVFSESCLVNLLEFANKHQIPIVADEVYGDLVFGSTEFIPMAKMAARLGRRVPVITASGLAKQFLLPGWRVGWITFHDNVAGSLKEVEAGAKSLAQVILGASHLAQSVIPKLLSQSTIEWRENLRHTLERQATFICSRLQECPGLHIFSPKGAMYAMVKIDTNVFLDDVDSDIKFSMKLLEEENIFVLPGSAFGAKNMFRIVFCSGEPLLEVAVERISNFCRRHQK